jgi:hypothetical protein
LRNAFDSIAQIEKGHHVGSLVAEGVGPTEGKPHVPSLSKKNPEVSELNFIPHKYISLEAVALATSVDDLCLMFALVLFTRGWIVLSTSDFAQVAPSWWKYIFQAHRVILPMVWWSDVEEAAVWQDIIHSVEVALTSIL